MSFLSANVGGENITRLNSFQKAQELAAELATARSILASVGALDRLQIEMETQQARATLRQLADQVQHYHRGLTDLQQQVVNVRDAAGLQEIGLYDFEHPAENSVALAGELKELREAIKILVKNGQAWTAATNFMYDGSAAKGNKFVNDLAKLMLSAYNAEAENAVKTVKAGSVQTAIKRIRSIRDRIEKYGVMANLRITDKYESLREYEISLAARHLAAVQAEKELERERKAELREQAKVEAELKKEQQRLQDQLRKEREHYERVIQQLRERGDEAAAAEAQAEMDAKLADVNKAIADVDYRVANQRAGYVYVISNIGAFGQQMVKIGMTRRLEPMDRIKELSSASVPFNYDVHALFFSDDAPGTEAMLHQEFAEQRVNKANLRREFFYATPEDVLKVLRNHDVTLVEYTVEPEAAEYRLSGGTVEATPTQQPPATPATSVADQPILWEPGRSTAPVWAQGIAYEHVQP